MGDVEEMIGELEASDDEDEEEPKRSKADEEEEEDETFGLDLDQAWSSTERED